MQTLFKKESRPILLFLSKKTGDQYGFGNKTLKTASYISINALIYDIDYAKISWKFPGLQTEEVKQLVIEKENLNVFLNTEKVIIDGVEFYGWEDNSGKTRYKNMGNFISIYIYRRN